METNKSILTRNIVGLDDRKSLGIMSELRINCDTLSVSHYIVNSVTTNAQLVLPFENVLAVGDTFITIQSRNEFLPAASPDAQRFIRDGFVLLGVDVYSRTGTALGSVESYDFDPVFGMVTSINLDNGVAFSSETFVFFSPDFVFVDNGEKTLAELRDAQTEEKDSPIEQASLLPLEDLVVVDTELPTSELLSEEAEASSVEIEAEPDTLVASASEPVAEIESEVKSDVHRQEAFAEDKVESGTTTSEEVDTDLVAFLLNATLIDDVSSKDGAFVAKKGTVLTQALIDDARTHDALLLLAVSADA